MTWHSSFFCLYSISSSKSIYLASSTGSLLRPDAAMILAAGKA